MVPRDRPAWQLISFAVRICQYHSCHTRESSMQTDHSYYAVPTLQHASFHVCKGTALQYRGKKACKLHRFRLYPSGFILHREFSHNI
jgi:hypothetical protein